MDVQSPEHLERLRDQIAFKAALLRRHPDPAVGEARFERSPKNTHYWPPIEQLAAHFAASGLVQETLEEHTLYGRPCWLLATSLAPSPNSPYAIAVAAADSAPPDALLSLLRDVTHDYWYGSSFFK